MAQLVDKAKNYVTDKVTNMRKPEASLSKFGLKGVSREGVDYLADVSIDNPYSHSIPICEISYVLKSDGRFALFSICRSINEIRMSHVFYICKCFDFNAYEFIILRLME